MMMLTACIDLRRPMIEASMHAMEFSVTVFHPDRPSCLACLCPVPPTWWKRKFPVFGAISGIAGSIAALEAIKLITNNGDPLIGKMIAGDMRTGHIRRIDLPPASNCEVCRVRR